MKTMQQLLLILFLTGLCGTFSQTPAFAAAEQIQQTEQKTEPIKTQTEAKSEYAEKSGNTAMHQEQNAKTEFNRKQTEEIPAFTWGNYFKAIGIMLLLLVLFWYVLKMVRKVGNGRFLPGQKLLPRDSMYLEGQLPLGQGKSILIVRVLNERLVLGVTEKNINLLTKTGINHAESFEELMRQTPAEDNTDA